MGEGERLVNFVWYRNVAEGAELDELMTDRDGLPRPLSLHPGHRAASATWTRSVRRPPDVLPAAAGEMVARTPQPFVQTIVDVEVPRMAFGRVCLIGDAAFTARPHAAAGTAKAAENGWALAAALDGRSRRHRAALARVGAGAARARPQPRRARPRRRRALAVPRHVGSGRPGTAVRFVRPRKLTGHKPREERGERFVRLWPMGANPMAPNGSSSA